MIRISLCMNIDVNKYIYIYRTGGRACEECVNCGGTVTQYRLPASIGIYHGPAGGEATDWMNIGVSVDSPQHNESWCVDLSAIASGVANESLFSALTGRFTTL